MNLSLLLNTVKYLRARQIFYQIKKRFINPKFKEILCPTDIRHTELRTIINKPNCLLDDKFTFLNIDSEFISWNDTEKGMLWAYNLNYMDYLNQKDISYNEGKRWINKFIDDLLNNKIGLDPYPIALRGINWIKFISKHKNEIDQGTLTRWNNSLYSQYCLLSKKLEYHLLGNHLLEDAYSLFMAAIYFEDKSLFKKASNLLLKELKEEILADGAHYEQSPMYHCILLDRLLDCYNISRNNKRFAEQDAINTQLAKYASLMLGHLESIIYSDKTIPLLNDSAYGIAPEPIEIFEYANVLDLNWESIPLKECGYRKFKNDNIEAIIDVGNIASSYQPGHTHADVFNYELRINDIPFIIDTGISTYTNSLRRQYERSTAAHNTVSVDNKDMHEVWGGFRVGKRAKVKIIEECRNSIKASHNGYGDRYIHTRTFSLIDDGLSITDEITNNANAVSYIHLSPETVILSTTKNEIITNNFTIEIEGATDINIIDDFTSKEYNKFELIKVVSIKFEKNLHYKITR